MQETFYTEEEIEALRRKYRKLLILKRIFSGGWVALTFAVPFFLLDGFDAWMIVGGSGTVYYFGKVIQHFGVLIGLVIVLLLSGIWHIILKKRYGSQIQEFEVAQANGNLKSNKWVNRILIVLVSIAVAWVAVSGYRDLTKITLREQAFSVSYRCYSVRVRETYSYDALSDIQLHYGGNGAALEFIQMNQESSKLYADLGRLNRAQRRLLETLDEKTEYRYHLTDQLDGK